MLVFTYAKQVYEAFTHISEAKFRGLVRLFALDLSGAQIAALTGLSKTSVCAILARIRARIAEAA